ncbi:MAG TPA: hypothetical protein DIT13_02025 [Verrucomicrobiales bacterium]|nr:hypothetical protein [Verrucomicrobiales bacterium]HRJ08579.1 transposase [Prosthecobacter sp.]HRK14488.1 transposase [Prosthecobacter sp.]
MTWNIPSVIPLPENFTGFDPSSAIPPENFTSYERHLPHWRIPGACYFTTFRLRDSIPKAVLEKMRREDLEWKQRLAKSSAQQGGMPSPVEFQAWQEFKRARLRKLELLLDEGRGECLLRVPAYREIVEKALRHFEGDRHEMLAWTVMPNHVHALLRPLHEHLLEDLCGSWKWFTASKIQAALQRTGPLWQEENFDRIIRDAAHYEKAVRYIANNPVKANLPPGQASAGFCQSIRAANGWP